MFWFVWAPGRLKAANRKKACYGIVNRILSYPTLSGFTIANKKRSARVYAVDKKSLTTLTKA
jgi:hypothetical protein